jgi:HAD superfamily hydrolase (TIGR01509 family)
MDVRGLILDMDGTIVEFKYNAGKVKKELKAFITLQGIPDEIFFDEEPLAVNVDRVMKYLMEKNDLHKIPLLKDGVQKITSKYEMIAARNTQLLDGAEGALEKLSSMDLKLAVFTNSGKKAMDTVVNRFCLETRFCCLLCREDVNRMKPHPDGIEQALDKLTLTRDQVLFVGDSTIDMEAAVTAGVTPVGVVSGLRGEEELREAGACHIIDSIRDLPKLVWDLWENEI